MNKPFNVLMIALDDLRPNLGCYGDKYAVTPHMDDLADRGTVFRRAYCQQAVCNPSRASLMTGCRPDTIRVWDLKTHFRSHFPDVVTLSQHFKNHGYRSECVGKIYHGKKALQDQASWSSEAEFSATREYKYVLPENVHARGKGFKKAATECADAEDNAYMDGMVADRAVERMRELNARSDPFFLAVGIRKPHLPFCAPKKYWDMQDKENIGVIANPLPPEDLLHYRLLETGYRCGFIGKSHIGTEKAPADYDFEGLSPPGYGDIKNNARFLNYLKSNGLSYSIKEPIYANPNQTTCIAGVWDGPTASTPPYFLAEETIGLLNQYAEQSAPFFLTCQFWDPHQPHLPSSEYAGLHDRDAIEPWLNFANEWHGKPEMVKRVHRDFYRQRPDSWRQWREVVGLYYDFTAMIDAQVGRVIDRLRELGLAENTIVVLTTDHGDMTGSHGGMLDKGYPYEEAHHIPLIVSCPELIQSGVNTDAMVYNMDIFPTLLDAAGISAPDCDGRSFLPLLQGDKQREPRRDIYLEFHGLRFLYSQRALVTEDGWKYVFTPGDTDEVYDLNTDPAELNNLAENPDCEERIGQLRERLMTVAAEVDDPLAPCIWKYFGEWRTPGDQFDATRL